MEGLQIIMTNILRNLHIESKCYHWSLSEVRLKIFSTTTKIYCGNT